MIRSIDETTFSAVGLRERGDLQRLLREQVEVISPETLVIAEEFGQWEESWRRIDLLGLDREANLVVIELKRTEDGGHMELQAIRYAAMVSTMSTAQLVETYAHYNNLDADAAEHAIAEWIEDFAALEQLSNRVRIILVSADFSTEVTST